MTEHVASTTKKFLAAGGLAFGLAGFGLFAGAGTAAATAPDTGSYDELLNIPDDNATHEVPNTGSYPGEPSWPGDSSHPCCSR
ncbi:MAG: hypothetical protein JWR37_3464 [Mycobacterium sp.]|jgi:hypothetical protein|nr:hypothetical protein [Mycobacterium sp.]